MESVLSTARTIVFAAAASVVSAIQSHLLAQSGDQASPPLVTIINSPDARLRTGNTALRMAIRDSDAPDEPIDQASIVVSRLDSSPAGPVSRTVSSNPRGKVAAMRLDSGDYAVTVRRVGYHAARFTIHVRLDCEQILEVYITRSVYDFDRCQVQRSGSPPCDPGAPPTPTRVVLTTCAHAA